MQQVTRISSEPTSFRVQLLELAAHRSLTTLFFKRDLSASHKQTFLGPIWILLQPVISSLIFMFVFSKVAKLPTDGIPPTIFFLSGIVFWGAFSSLVGRSSDVLVANAGLFSKVYFPRLSIPLSLVLSVLLNLAMQTLLLLGVSLYFSTQGSVQVSWNLLLLPIPIVALICFGLGIGLSLSALTYRYRDLAFLTQFGLQILMYLSPVVYSYSILPEEILPWMKLNPLSAPIIMFRACFTGQLTPDFEWVAVNLTCCLIVFIFGAWLFSRAEQNFVDAV